MGGSTGLRFRTRLYGAIGVYVGLVYLLLPPFAHYRGPVGEGDALLGLVYLPAAFFCIWASLLVWGLATLATGRVRSLTPLRATLPTVLALIPVALLRLQRPFYTMDETAGIVRRGPVDVLELAIDTVGYVPFLFVGSTLFLVVGVAFARGQWGWYFGSLTSVPVYSTVHVLARDGSTAALVFAPILAALPGLILYYAGKRLAADVDSDGRSDDAPSPGVQPIMD